MEHLRYTPFLKLKANEVAAIASLRAEVKQLIVPFFDIARRSDMSAASFCLMVSKAASKLKKHIGLVRPYFLDNYDIPDEIVVNGLPNYQFVMEEFAEMNFIPVVGLNRTPAHNQVVFDAKASGLVKSDVVAVRLVEDDFESFDLIEDELASLCDEGSKFSHWVLILDCGMCRNVDPNAHAVKIAHFIDQAQPVFEFAQIIVTGSSIPASIGEVAKVDKRSLLERVELQIYDAVKAASAVDQIGFGDYTVVSPLYSDVTLPPEMMRNVTAPKVLYSHQGHHYIARGGALKTHARGNLQYNDIAVEIVSQPFYRGAPYSFGDNFLDEKAKMIGKNVTPGSILNPTINAHITYMATDHPLVV